MTCCCGHLSGVTCRLFAYGPADATASHNRVISCLIEIQTGFTFQAVLEKKPLNSCSSSSTMLVITRAIKIIL